ncbi:MAG: LON peptidase substrate-binding domain-containing protein [Proteobacteria bacterium]|nr:LON peptidase substrate-binding domain-containing protein [Pseudomonadota bacterium]HQR04438.1 LON peptidase substrate-binding domain-containing protein [Rhodocyclaceae bacterium]
MGEEREIPLFPLGTVLFPGGRLPLRIFETRYMDMAKASLRDKSPFGICLIAEGAEVGLPAVPHETGTLARIVQWDMPQFGVLEVMVEGGQCFDIVDRRVEPSRLQRARVTVRPAPAAEPVPERYARLTDMLRAIAGESGGHLPPPHDFDNLHWVAYRLSERMPLPMLVRQQLLELRESASRIEMVYRLLQQQGVRGL